MSIKRTISDDGKQVVISVSGQFDERAHDDFKAAFLETWEKCEAYVVDLSQVTHMLSSGLGLLILFTRNAGLKNASVRILNPSTPAKRNLELAFLNQILDICFE